MTVRLRDVGTALKRRKIVTYLNQEEPCSLSS